jgi:phosphonate metabolism protein PhnN/1,5-bisphosphokinase (PRPP-forming)
MNPKVLPKSELLIFVVGTSGSGKDSVMRETAAYLNRNGIPAQLLKRFITRPSDKNEESFFITNENFINRKEEFALSWYIYDNWYGCPWEGIEKAIKKREILLINISRAVLFQAREVFPHCKIVLITVPKSIAESRVKHRGREDEKGVEKRLSRMSVKIDMPSPDKIIENTGDLEEAAEKLGKYLKTIYFSVVNS